MSAPHSTPRSAEQVLVEEARAQLAWSLKKVRHCLGQLDDAQLWWRPTESQNSIGNLLLHLAGNLSQRIGSLVGGDPDTRDRPEEFAERGPIPKAELLRRFEQAVSRSDQVLAGLTPEELSETRAYDGLTGTLHGTVLAVIFRTMTHLTGHTQEIIYITRLRRGDDYVPGEPAATWPKPAAPAPKDTASP